ncbi:hypothetical protein [Bacillus pseudomycoides]|uniref:hypothetical protein n=1 Tax=Bacillus pseudomycoides TaxID=64104 RepID=UPI000BF379E3|nr:hypothetical protein [Bacillus pseudomycoides]PGE00027.1 hypothetical protein COM50_07075 [Bacillus pseudomycoides]PHE19229.1 hypothetical protein COF59_08350 [Bacillus pseudomycoides]
MNVMKKAWEIARKGQRNFGGKVKEYFTQALKMAWKIVKKSMNNFTSIFNAIEKDAKKQAQEFFKGYIQLMQSRGVNILNLKDTSATMCAPNAPQVSTYVLCEQDSWVDGVAMYRAGIFIEDSNGRRLINQEVITFKESDYIC